MSSLRVSDPADGGVLNLMAALDEIGVRSLMTRNGNVYLLPYRVGQTIRLTIRLQRELVRLKPKLLELLPVIPQWKDPAKETKYV